MTKQVRIENACMGVQKLVVEVWERRTNCDVKAQEIRLDSPTNLGSFYVTQTQYLVVKEVEDAK